MDEEEEEKYKEEEEDEKAEEEEEVVEEEEEDEEDEDEREEREGHHPAQTFEGGQELSKQLVGEYARVIFSCQGTVAHITRECVESNNSRAARREA